MKSIRQLSILEMQKYAEHLKRLNSSDRYLRFGIPIKDERIQRYVDTQDQTKQLVLAVFDENLNIVAALELMFDESRYSIFNEVAEIGLSVNDTHRNLGLGSALFERAIEVARNRGVETLVSHCLRENRWMNAIAKSHGMAVVVDVMESSAKLQLPKADQSSITGELLGEGMALWDFAFMSSLTKWVKQLASLRPASMVADID